MSRCKDCWTKWQTHAYILKYYVGEKLCYLVITFFNRNNIKYTRGRNVALIRLQSVEADLEACKCRQWFYQYACNMQNVLCCIVTTVLTAQANRFWDLVKNTRAAKFHLLKNDFWKCFHVKLAFINSKRNMISVVIVFLRRSSWWMFNTECSVLLFFVCCRYNKSPI